MRGTHDHSDAETRRSASSLRPGRLAFASSTLPNVEDEGRESRVYRPFFRPLGGLFKTIGGPCAPLPLVGDHRQNCPESKIVSLSWALLHGSSLGRVFACPQMVYAAMFKTRTEPGLPAASMQLRTATPTAVSACWQEKLRDRRREPIKALYRPIAVSTRARRP